MPQFFNAFTNQPDLNILHFDTEVYTAKVVACVVMCNMYVVMQYIGVSSNNIYYITITKPPYIPNTEHKHGHMPLHTHRSTYNFSISLLDLR